MDNIRKILYALKLFDNSVHLHKALEKIIDNRYLFIFHFSVKRYSIEADGFRSVNDDRLSDYEFSRIGYESTSFSNSKNHFHKLKLICDFPLDLKMIYELPIIDQKEKYDILEQLNFF